MPFDERPNYSIRCDPFHRPDASEADALKRDSPSPSLKAKNNKHSINMNKIEHKFCVYLKRSEFGAIN